MDIECANVPQLSWKCKDFNKNNNFFPFHIWLHYIAFTGFLFLQDSSFAELFVTEHWKVLILGADCVDFETKSGKSESEKEKKRGDGKREEEEWKERREIKRKVCWVQSENCWVSEN